MRQPLITNIQKYSIHDGRGIRTTIFFKGCPLSCQWCHNPETQSFQGAVLFYQDRCIGCGACARSCPEGAIHIKEDFGKSSTEGVFPAVEGVGKGNPEGIGSSSEDKKRAVTDSSRCKACGSCLDDCLHNARELCGTRWEIRDLVKEALKDRAFYETSGGGVTLSGGEVLAQDTDYIGGLMKLLHERGISVFVDTCGAVPRQVFERVLPYTDTFLFDIKLLDSAKHEKYTGRGNEQILDNLKWLSAQNAGIWIRIPVIGGVNDSEEEIREIGLFLKENQIRYRQIHLLPYHNTGSGKYEHLGKNYEGKEFFVPDQEKMERLKQILEMEGQKPVYIGG